MKSTASGSGKKQLEMVNEQLNLSKHVIRAETAGSSKGKARQTVIENQIQAQIEENKATTGTV